MAIGQSRFRVEEMVIHRKRQRGHILVVDTIARITHISVLHIGIERQQLLRMVDDAPVEFGVGVGIKFIGRVAVVFVGIGAVGYWQWAMGYWQGSGGCQSDRRGSDEQPCLVVDQGVRRGT